jgi:arsenate reductase
MNLNIQIFGTPKCQETNKALRFFKERGIKVHSVDLREKPLAKGELENISRSVPIDKLIDKESKEYDKLGLEHMIYDTFEKLLEHPLIIKTPIVRNGKISTSGYCPEIWKEWINSAKVK